MARKTQPAAAEAVETVEKTGLNIDDGIILTTFFCLVGALALVLVALEAYPKIVA
jgi:hypothetical protein